MANSTSRLALPLPVGSDPPSELRTAISALSTAMDPSVLYYSGTLANRGTVVSSPLAGYLYYATDTTTLYEYNGSAWLTCVIAQPWQALSLASNVISAGDYTPSARLEGDIVRLKGVLTNNTGGTITSFATWATIPSGLRPTSAAALTFVAQAGGAANLIAIGPTGVIYVEVNVSNGLNLNLDGITFTIS